MANEQGQALFNRFSVASGQFSFWTQTDTPEEVAADKEHVAARDELRAFLEAQSAQIAELHAEVERKTRRADMIEKSAGFATDEVARLEDENKALKAQTADRTRALDTARHDAREVIRLWAIDRHGQDLSWRNHMDAAVSALQTKDQSHGA